MNKSEAIETSIGYHYVEEDVLYIVFKEGLCIDVEESKEARLILQEGKSMKVLVDSRGLFQITKEARAYAAEPKSAEMSSAMAIVIGSLGTRLLTNFFIKFNKPNGSVRMFNSIEKALEWLGKFR